MNPLLAPSHPDPYPYYDAVLRRETPWYEEELGMWVVARASHVDEVLSHAAARVRPPGEPVPKALLSTPAGDIFGAFARMTDGTRHETLRRLVEAQIGMLTPAMPAPACGDEDLNAYIERFAIDSIVRALGFSENELPMLMTAVRTFTRGDASGGTELFERFAARFTNDTLEELSARISLLFQAYDATRALVGNTLMAQPFCDVDDAIDATMVHDPPVHNTRRYFSADASIGGISIRKDDCVLVLLAAATRDSGRPYGFGAGAHACPGERLAKAIAAAAIRSIVDGGNAMRFAVAGYAASQNCRIPILRKEAAA